MDIDKEGHKARFEDALKIITNKHDIVGIRVYDPRESTLPDVGALELVDAETRERIWVDTSSQRVREHYARHWQESQFIIDNVLMRYKVDNVAVSTDEDYVKALIKLFKKR